MNSPVEHAFPPGARVELWCSPTSYDNERKFMGRGTVTDDYNVSPPGAAFVPVLLDGKERAHFYTVAWVRRLSLLELIAEAAQ